MRILGAVVLPPTALMAGANPKIMRGGSIRAQIVSDQSIWDEPAFLQEFAHQFQPGILVSLALDQHVKNLALGVDGAPQIGHAAVFPCPYFPAAARATLRADGTAPVETAGADMGQGAWTALPQIAAESLGVHIDQVEFRSGASLLPDGGVAGGSGHTASAGLALRNAGEHALAQLAELAAADPASPLFGASNVGFTARDGRLHHRGDESRSQSFADILARAGRAEVTGSAKAARHPSVAESRALYSHGAVFAEVKVDPDLGQIRATHLVGAFAAGRIINPHLARSQYLGGMIWGLSFALQEEAITDRRTGRIMNTDLAEYHVPVNADAPSVEAILIHEDDPHINSLGVKGVGEIGVTGTVGAIANAVWHATGVRIRRYPIRIEDIAIAR
jgi:xanthine dehydrogenase YagR molybdenum-binding subunit